MLQKRVKIGIIIAVAIYILYSFITSFSIPNAKSKTEFSGKLSLIRTLETNSNWKTLGLNYQSNTIPRLPITSTIRQQLSYQFPYDVERPFEKNIWQTWKVGLDSNKFPPSYRRFLTSWSEINSGYNHYVLPDDECHELIDQLYSTVPDVARAYRIMPKSILKADFFRYLILYARGGVYSDIDTTGIKPVDTWLSNNATIYGKPNIVGLVVGIEADPDRPDWADWYARRIQFCQWTIQAKSGHPMLRELVAKITEITLQREKKNQLNKVLGKDLGGDIMNWTGPGIWTDSVFEYMNNISQDPQSYNTKKYEDIITWKLFTGMEVPIAVEDVLVLPITSFSPDVGQMGAKSTHDPWCYGKHMFLGSWKDDKPKHKPKNL